MQKIFKYPLDNIGSNDVIMPHGSEPLTVQLQDGRPVMWAIVDPANISETHIIDALFTGMELEGNKKRKYLSTVILPNGIVIHFFQRLK